MDTDERTGELVTLVRRAAAHPYKLAVDVAAIIAAMVPLWSHHWLIALLVAVVPSLVATAAVAVLDRARVVRDVATWVQLARVAALAVAVAAAWTHDLVLLGAALIVGSIVLFVPPAIRHSVQIRAGRS